MSRNKKKIKVQKKNNTITKKEKKVFISQFFWYYILIVTLTFVVYGWTVNFNWGLDDKEFIVNPINKILNNWNGIQTLLSQPYGQYDYRPVTLLSFWLEFKIFGELQPQTAHLVNVFIFSILLIQIFRFVVIAKFYEDKQKLIALALLTTFFFLFHPVHVSVVANIKSRDTLLSMFFGITALIQFIQFLGYKNWWRFLLFSCLIIFALLSKRDAYIFLIIPIIYYFVIYNNRNVLHFIKTKKFILIVISFVGVSIIIQLIINNLSNHFLADQNEIVRSQLDSPLFYNDTFVNRVSFTLITLWYYFKFMIIPYGYYFYFGYNQIPLTNLFNIFNVLSLFIYISAFILSIKYFKKDKIYLFSFLFFMLAIAYAANFFLVVSGILMDRYSFIGSLGFLLALSAFIIFITKASNWHVVYNKYVLIIFSILIIATYYRTSAWKDIETLFNRDISHLSNSSQANSMVGGYYINQAIFGEDYSNVQKNELVKYGEAYIDKALKINQQNKFALESKGLCLIYFNNDNNAIPYLRKAIVADTNYVGSYNNLGLAFRNLNQLDSAIKYFGIAMQKDQLFSYPADNYIQMLIRKQQYDAVDSTLLVLQNRFPNDVQLSNRIFKWKQSKVW